MSMFSGRRSRLRRSACVATLGFLIAWSAPAGAQDAVKTTFASLNYQVAASDEPASPSAARNPGNGWNLHDVATSPEGEISGQPRRFQYGLRLTVRGVYDDNINISHTNRISDYYFAIEPALTLGLGDIIEHQENYIRLDYIPSVFLYVDHSENDAVQQLVRLEGNYRFSRLTLTMREDIAILDGTDLGVITDVNSPGSHVNLDVSGRTRLNSYDTHLDASYDLSAKTFLSSGFECLVTDYPHLISSQVVSGNLFINYRYSPKLVVGLGGTAGYDFVDDPTGDQTFEQANVRASYQLTGKVSLNASAGIEFRQFSDSSRPEYTSPVFEISASYQPFDGTTMTLSARRRTLNSAVFAAQDFTSTNITFGARQRLLGRVYLGISAGYENSDYFSTVNGVSAPRRDNYYFVEPAADVSITRFWTIGAYYLHRQNDSSLDSFDFYDNQVGLRTALIF